MSIKRVYPQALLSGLALKALPFCVAALLAPAAVSFAADGKGASSKPENLFGLENVCEGTSRAAYLACFNEKQDDFWIGLGTCNYISDMDERGACYDENRMAREEGNDECLAAEEARNELCEMLGEDRYDPEYAPEDFVDPDAIGDTVEPNPFFPLVPGYRWVYEGNGEHIEVEVLDETKVIDGVLCRVVRDTVTEVGSPDDEGGGESTPQQDEDEDGAEQDGYVEDTLDWYAQDMEGNVWYFGEISQSFEDGELDNLEGSWKAGKEGAKPGILVHATPVVGSIYRQEFLLGDAEDMAQVVSLDSMPELSDTNPADCSLGCLQTDEWTPIEEDSHEFKYYQPGVGFIKEENPSTGEEVELVEFSNGE